MAEEQPCQAPEGHRLCANNCGIIGNPATMNLCSKCYGDVRLKNQQDASTKSTIENALSSSSSIAASIVPVAVTSIASIASPPLFSSESTVILTQTPIEIASSSVTQTPIRPNRCLSCRKRVGLTGFKCKCGSMFCGTHRYPERHGCGFDFKTVGREEISRANPLIRAEKLQRI